VVHIITTYLDGDDDDNENENENVAPDGQSFSFGAATNKCTKVNDDFGFVSSANNDFVLVGARKIQWITTLVLVLTRAYRFDFK